jgi:hypothetical protein
MSKMFLRHTLTKKPSLTFFLTAYNRYEQLYTGYNNNTIHNVKNETTFNRLICYIEVTFILSFVI